MKEYPSNQLLVTPRQLAVEIASATPPLVLDLRPPDAYTAGHVRGATHLDLWGVSLIDTDPAPLDAFMWMIEHVLAAHGVNSNTPVVVYDDRSGMRAARAFWFLEYFGHPNVRLLDGGFTAWTAGGFDVTRDAGGHLAFGHGVHHCLGAPLARMEMRIAFPALLRRFPGLALAVPFEEVGFRAFHFIYGLQTLPVRW